MMAPQDDGSATFQSEVLDDCKRSDILLRQPPDASEDVWAGIDPAIDGWMAITVAAVRPDRMRLMSSEHWFQVSTGEAILAHIRRVWEQTKFTRLIVEAVSFQKYMARDERLEKMRRECGFTIVEHTTASNKMDITFGVARMASSFIDETILIPSADKAASDGFAPLIAELVQWRATIPTRLRTQDLVMSLWFVWVKWQEYRKNFEHRTTSIKGEGMPFKPMHYSPGTFKYDRSVVR
jgi:hypothetical protein